MNENFKKEKTFSMVNMIIIECVLIYITLRIGDAISVASQLPSIMTRYIPIGIVIAIATNFLIKSGAQKSYKFEIADFNKKIKIIPIIVAVIVLIYGFISVNSNVSKIEEKMGSYKSFYSSLYSKNSYDELMAEAKSKAIMSWIITSCICLIAGEVVTFITKDSIYYLFKDEEQIAKEDELRQEEISSTDNYYGNESTNENNSNDTIKNIKWNL